MLLPLSMLKSFIDKDLSIQKIEETLTLLGIEIDAVHSPQPSFSGVVVAEVKSAARHPSAEKLQVAEVFDGKTTHQVICGASNCRAGMRTAFARLGARLADANGTVTSIEKAAIRGVDSFGMLCSSSELNLGWEEPGILELPTDIPLGKDCAEFLWDPVLELSLTPNLGHCMSALGIARELAAAWQIPLKWEKRTELDQSRSSFSVVVEDEQACPRYTARILEQVAVKPSPFWLQMQLRSAGHRPINNVVDAANYMLLKYGQPMHAFDLDLLEGKAIRVARLKTDCAFAGLDKLEWKAPAGTLAIWDAKKPVALAGILGGDNSAVSAATRNILLEAAAFDPIAVRQASKKMGLRTDSSYRFEKGVDQEAVAHCLNEAAELIAEISGGKIAPGMADTGKEIAPRFIHCRPDRVNRILGTRLSIGEIESIFKRLECKTKKESSGQLRVEIPHYRNDLNEEIDLIEEVARLYGYNNIERPLPKSTSPQIPHDPVHLFEEKMRSALVGLGLQEFITCDLISPKLAESAQELSHSDAELLQTLHSKSEEFSILRPSLLPGLLQSTRHNIDQKNHHLRAFEIGRIHFRQKGKPVEFPMAAILLTGKVDPQNWDKKDREADFYDLKGMVENLLAALRIRPVSFAASTHPILHPGRQADLLIDGLSIGSLGEIHPRVLQRFDIKQKVYYAELNGAHLQAHLLPAAQMVPLPQFPSSERDWTIALPHNIAIHSAMEKLHAISPPLLEKFELLDLYRTDQANHATFRFTYRDLGKTISFDEVESAHGELISRFSQSS